MNREINVKPVCLEEAYRFRAFSYMVDYLKKSSMGVART
jgi:hypothetical protein